MVSMISYWEELIKQKCRCENEIFSCRIGSKKAYFGSIGLPFTPCNCWCKSKYITNHLEMRGYHFDFHFLREVYYGR